MLSILLAIIWFSGILYWDVISDYNRWMKESIDHTKEGIMRTFLLVPSTLLLCYPEFSIWNIVASVILQATVWWELFDGFYNNKRRFHWRFNGTIEPDDPKLDIFLRKLSPRQQAALKWGLILISLIMYIIIINN